MIPSRFRDLKNWQLAIEIADELYEVADDPEKERLYRFADQLRGSGMSMSNNMSEGSGSSIGEIVGMCSAPCALRSAGI